MIEVNNEENYIPVIDCCNAVRLASYAGQSGGYGIKGRCGHHIKHQSECTKYSFYRVTDLDDSEKGKSYHVAVEKRFLVEGGIR